VTDRPSRERFVALESAAAAASFVEAWEHLADAPLERNVFAEPWMLLAALDCFAREEPVRIGLTFDAKSEELTGVFPFVRRSKWNRLPVPVVCGWIHSQCYLGTPLLHRDPERARRAIDCFVRSNTEGLVEFEDVSGDGEFIRLLMEVVHERQLPWYLTSSITRPVLLPRGSADEYLAAALDGDGRRKLRSKEKGLASTGAVQTRAVETPSELDDWISLYLRLEKEGWKGKYGSALANDLDGRRYFETIVREGFRRGRVTAITLSAGERPVAVKLNFKSGDEWFAYKIAYDEEFSRYSPGLLLEVDNIRRMHALPGARSMDSCTGPTTRVFRDLWLDRRAIQSVTVATGREPAALVLAAMPLLRWGKSRAARLVPGLERQRERKPAPRETAALPLASNVPLPKRITASPAALLATTIAGARNRPGDLHVLLNQAVKLQCAGMRARDFHDCLDIFFGHLDTEEVLSRLDYRAIRNELFTSREDSVVRRVGANCRIGHLVRLVASLSIRLDFELLRAGQHIPPHGHSRVASGFSVVEGKVGVRRYDLVESEPDAVSLRPTFDGVLETGKASTESDVRDNVHWIVALEDSVLFRVTASAIPSQSRTPTSLNVWVDPRSPMRGNGTILGRWVPEAVARAIPPFTAHVK
jgi:hypothetical protein